MRPIVGWEAEQDYDRADGTVEMKTLRHVRITLTLVVLALASLIAISVTASAFTGPKRKVSSSQPAPERRAIADARRFAPGIGRHRAVIRSPKPRHRHVRPHPALPSEPGVTVAVATAVGTAPPPLAHPAPSAVGPTSTPSPPATSGAQTPHGPELEEGEPTEEPPFDEPPAEEPPVEEPPVEEPPVGSVQTSHCFASPHLCGYPDATNTGVPAGTMLNPSGSMTISRAGTVVSGADVTGWIDIVADDVTIENTRVTLNGSGCGTSQTCGNYDIRIDEGVTGTVIKDTALLTAPGTTCEHAIRNTSGPDLVIERVYMDGCDSNLYGGATMKDSYGLAQLAISSDHVENIYFNETSFSSIHNTLLNPVGQTAVIFGNSGNGTDVTNCSNRLTLVDSLVAGGGYTLYPCAHSSQSGSSTLNVEGNHFARCLSPETFNPNGGDHPCAGGADSSGYYPNSGAYGIATDYYSGVGTWRGNVWDDNLAKVCIEAKRTSCD